MSEAHIGWSAKVKGVEEQPEPDSKTAERPSQGSAESGRSVRHGSKSQSSDDNRVGSQDSNEDVGSQSPKAEGEDLEVGKEQPSQGKQRTLQEAG